MKKISIVIIILSIAACSYAQQPDAMKEIEKIKAFYSGPELKHVTGQMLLTDKTTGRQIDKVDFEYWIKDKQLYTKMNYIEILNSDNLYIMVNHRLHSICVRPVKDNVAKTASPYMDISQLEKLLSMKNIKSSVSSSGGLNKLTLSGLQGSNFSDVTVNYETADNRIRSFYANVINASREDKDQLVLQVTYTKTEKINVTTDPPVFSPSKYVVIGKGGELSFNGVYQGYTKL